MWRPEVVYNLRFPGQFYEAETGPIHGPQLGRLLVVRQRRMTDADWVSVAEYADVPSAQVVSRRLTMDGIQNRIVSNFSGPAYNQNGACSIWVPPQSAADAKRLLQDPP